MLRPCKGDFGYDFYMPSEEGALEKLLCKHKMPVHKSSVCTLYPNLCNGFPFSKRSVAISGLSFIKYLLNCAQPQYSI